MVKTISSKMGDITALTTRGDGNDDNDNDDYDYDDVQETGGHFGQPNISLNHHHHHNYHHYHNNPPGNVWTLRPTQPSPDPPAPGGLDAPHQTSR